ncbi:MAG: hypothetical protein GWN01_15525 [Nitrosopumilaceae archaeon]|nr:hypothetical protein [Nitrosopumilaceae archaeon]NIV65599.1 hypothetical protein [Nitrosopumilaceae archaeon]NIX62854.1 hypothetical protein [Nitrosopumilaceae archaeon]
MWNSVQTEILLHTKKILVGMLRTYGNSWIRTDMMQTRSAAVTVYTWVERLCGYGNILALLIICIMLRAI